MVTALALLLTFCLQNFLVDINGPFAALLPQLSFEGATKRNRPNLRTGDLVYCRVTETSRDTDTVLTCVDAAGRAGSLGPLKEGSLLSVSTATARKLLTIPKAPVLEALGAALQFEVAVGANGRVWVQAPKTVDAIVVCNVLKSSEKLNESQTRTLVSRMVAETAS